MRIFVCKLRLHYRIANTFVASYAMKYSEIFFVTRKFLAYTTAPPPPDYIC
jgi:hypothetical protein